MIHWDLAIRVKEIIQGGAPGIDSCAKKVAEELLGHSRTFDANWNAYGKSAGPKRNRQMAEYGDALLVIWDGESRGSANMKEEMLKLGKPVYEVVLKQYNTKDENGNPKQLDNQTHNRIGQGST